MLLLSGDPIAGLIYPDTLHETEFPKARSMDLATAIRLIREKYSRFYPTLNFEAVALADQPEDITSSNGTGEGTVQEFDDTTNWDDLYGEPVPDGYDDSTDDDYNPHSDLDVDATNTMKYEDPVAMPVHINHEPTQKELDKFGVEESHAIILTFFLPLLKERGLNIGMGGKFFWKRHEYVIWKYERWGYWKNTSVHLYIRAACRLKGYGS